jgi:hypothetical protein
MKKLFILLSLLYSLSSAAQTPVPFSSLTLYTGSLDSVKYVGLIKAGSVYANRLFYGVDLVKTRLLISDTAAMLSAYRRIADLAQVAMTGSYTDLINKPTLLTVGNGLLNNSGVVEWGGNQPLTKSVFIAGSPWDIQFGTSSITAGASLNSFRVFTHNGWTLSDSATGSNPAKIFANSGTITIQGAGTLFINMATNIQLFNIATNADSTTYKPLEISSGGLIRKGVWYNQSPMTTLGDLPYEDGTPKPVRLAGNTTTTKKFLTQTGDGAISAAPLWDVLIAADVPTLNQNTTGTASNITGVLGASSMPALTGDVTNSSGSLATTISSNVVSNAKLATMGGHTFKGNNTGSTANAIDLTATQATAELNTFTTSLKGLVPSPGSTNGFFLKDDGTWAAPAGGGFSNPMTTLGDIIVENSTPAAARLAGNTTATKKFLVQTGNGSISAVPAWDIIIAGDVPTLNQNTTGSAGSISGTNVITNANIVQAAANSFKGNNTGSAATQIDLTVAQAKTLLAINESDVSNLTTDLGNKQSITTAATGLTAAGTTQGTALALSGNNSIQEVTTAAASTGVKLPTATSSSWIMVVNRGANALTVYPATSGIINGQSANAGYTLAAGASRTFIGKDATSWYTQTSFTAGDAATTDGSSALTVTGIKGASVPSLTNGFLKYTGSWTFDNSTYLTANQSISFTPGAGDVTGSASGATSLTPTLTIGTNVVSNAKAAQMAANTLKGNNTGSTANAIDMTVSQAKTLLAITESDVANLSTDLSNKQPVTTVATGLTAAGTNQATGLVLSGANSLQEITTAASGTGAVLPTASTTASVSIINRGANAIVVYPASGASINGQSANTGFTLPVNGAITFQGKSSTAWYTDNSFQNGDVNTTDGSAALTIGTNKVTNSQLAQMSANTIKGNNTGSTANAADLTVAQTKTLLAITESDVASLTTDLSAKAPIDNPTFTGLLTLPTGTSSVAPLNIPSGTLLTTATAGKVENNGYSLFFTPTGTQRGIMANYQFATIASGTVALSSATGLQSLFASANDAVSLSANTTYRFEGDYFITKGTTTTCTVNTGFTYSGTMATIAYAAMGMSAAADANATTQGVYVDRLTSTAITATGVAAGVMLHISGRLVTTTAGTLTPQIAFSAAPGGTNTVNAPTYFEIWPVGIDTMTSIGAWQ